MSWLKPYLRTWYSAYPEGIAPVRQLAHYLKPLRQAHSETRIVSELAAYLARTEACYVSLPRFAATFGSWNRPAPKDQRPYSQSVDDMDRNAGIIP